MISLERIQVFPTFADGNSEIRTRNVTSCGKTVGKF